MTLKLPRLPIGWLEQPQLFERYWHDVMTQVESNINALESLPIIQQAVADANAAAATANAAAATANAATVVNKTQASIVTSFIDQSSYTGSLLSCTSAGVITILSHTRIYGDSILNPPVSVIGGSLVTVGSASGNNIRIYYTDPTRAGGNVTYQYTIDPVAAPVQGGDIHSIGAVKVPASGSVYGIQLGPPGYIYI